MITRNIFAALLGLGLLAGCGGNNVQDADLDRALDVTDTTLTKFESMRGSLGAATDEVKMQEFSAMLIRNMNTAAPPVHPDPLGLEMQEDGAMAFFHDRNADGARSSGDKNLFKIEIDGEDQRLIASTDNGYTRTQGFSGSGLLTGFIIGSMLNRQRGAGIAPGSFKNRAASPKRSAATSPKPSARSKSGSGSYSSGK